MSYALSHPEFPEFQHQCHHHHNMLCPTFNEVDYILEDLQGLYDMVDKSRYMNNDDLQEMRILLEDVGINLHKYVAHRIRTIHQITVPGDEISRTLTFFLHNSAAHSLILSGLEYPPRLKTNTYLHEDIV